MWEIVTKEKNPIQESKTQTIQHLYTHQGYQFAGSNWYEAELVEMKTMENMRNQYREHRSCELLSTIKKCSSPSSGGRFAVVA